MTQPAPEKNLLVCKDLPPSALLHFVTVLFRVWVLCSCRAPDKGSLDTFSYIQLFVIVAFCPGFPENLKSYLFLKQFLM